MARWPRAFASGSHTEHVVTRHRSEFQALADALGPLGVALGVDLVLGGIVAMVFAAVTALVTGGRDRRRGHHRQAMHTHTRARGTRQLTLVLQSTLTTTTTTTTKTK